MSFTSVESENLLNLEGDDKCTENVCRESPALFVTEVQTTSAEANDSAEKHGISIMLMEEVKALAIAAITLEKYNNFPWEVKLALRET